MTRYNKDLDGYVTATPNRTTQAVEYGDGAINHTSRLEKLNSKNAINAFKDFI